MCQLPNAPMFAHIPRPFQPASGSSMRPSIPFVKNPIGYGTRSTTNSPSTRPMSASELLPVRNGTFAPSPSVLC